MFERVINGPYKPSAVVPQDSARSPARWWAPFAARPQDSFARQSAPMALADRQRVENIKTLSTKLEQYRTATNKAQGRWEYKLSATACTLFAVVTPVLFGVLTVSSLGLLLAAMPVAAAGAYGLYCVYKAYSKHTAHLRANALSAEIDQLVKTLGSNSFDVQLAQYMIRERDLLPREREASTLRTRLVKTAACLSAAIVGGAVAFVSGVSGVGIVLVVGFGVAFLYHLLRANEARIASCELGAYREARDKALADIDTHGDPQLIAYKMQAQVDAARERLKQLEKQAHPIRSATWGGLATATGFTLALMFGAVGLFLASTLGFAYAGVVKFFEWRDARHAKFEAQQQRQQVFQYEQQMLGAFREARLPEPVLSNKGLFDPTKSEPTLILTPVKPKHQRPKLPDAGYGTPWD